MTDSKAFPPTKPGSIITFDDYPEMPPLSSGQPLEEESKPIVGEALSEFPDRRVVRVKPVLGSDVMKRINEEHDPNLLFGPHETRPFVNWLIEVTDLEKKSD